MNDRMILQSKVPAEYPFSLTTIIRWRKKGILSTFRQGEKRVLLSRIELDALVCAKEKVRVGSTDEEVRNEGVNPNSEDKGMHFSRNRKNINVKNSINSEKNEDSRPKA